MCTSMIGETCNILNAITQHHNISLLRKLAGQKCKIRRGNLQSKNSLRRTLHRKIVKQAKPIDNIVNPVTITLTEAQTSIVNKGLSFVQAPRLMNFKKIEKSCTDFGRKLPFHIVWLVKSHISYRFILII